MRRSLVGALGALALPLAACTPASTPPPATSPTPPRVSQADWTLSRARLANLRRAQPGRAYVERVRVSMLDSRTGRHYEARGAVAVSPDRAARMMLVGPGGATALDLWVSKDRFRMAVPAIELEKCGGKDPDEARGLPVGLLRWWFLSPLTGRLLVARSTPGETAWVLKEGQATIAIRSDGVRFVAVRREAGRSETIEWLGRGLVPRSGARCRYVESSYGLRVDVLVEEVLPTAPDPEAFADPDEKETAL